MALQDVVVMDVGGGSVKMGSARQPDTPKVFPNASAKLKGERQTFVGEAMLGMKDVLALSLRRPVDRGYVVDWSLQREILARALKGLLGGLSASACGLVLTEPYLNLPALREAAVPVFDWRVLPAAIRRVDLGGKALTNFMKELVSYRSVNMMDETYLLEHIKEQLCFVSQDTAADLRAARGRASPFRREYVLPDGLTDTWGHVRTEEEAAAAAAAARQQQRQGGPQLPKQPVLQVNNERFMVPEAIFHPSDIGMEEAGLAEAIAAAVQAAHPHLHGLLWSNVLLTGGTSRCPGFRERLHAELRPLVPDDYELGIHLADDPVLCAWRGAALLAASPSYPRLAVTQKEWRSRGTAALAKWEQ